LTPEDIQGGIFEREGQPTAPSQTGEPQATPPNCHWDFLVFCWRQLFAAGKLRAEVPPFVESWVILFLHRPSLPCVRRQITGGVNWGGNNIVVNRPIGGNNIGNKWQPRAKCSVRSISLTTTVNC
jgi:hypothetical protein